MRMKTAFFPAIEIVKLRSDDTSHPSLVDPAETDQVASSHTLEIPFAGVVRGESLSSMKSRHALL
jgi:hypothetical protein